MLLISMKNIYGNNSIALSGRKIEWYSFFSQGVALGWNIKGLKARHIPTQRQSLGEKNKRQ